MKRNTQNPEFGIIPELESVIRRYGTRLSAHPPYVLIGTYRSQVAGHVMGILAAASNEFHAHLLRRELNRNGHVSIECTEHHPTHHTFSIAAYRQKFRDRTRRNP